MEANVLPKFERGIVESCKASFPECFSYMHCHVRIAADFPTFIQYDQLAEGCSIPLLSFVKAGRFLSHTLSVISFHEYYLSLIDPTNPENERFALPCLPQRTNPLN